MQYLSQNGCSLSFFFFCFFFLSLSLSLSFFFVRVRGGGSSPVRARVAKHMCTMKASFTIRSICSHKQGDLSSSSSSFRCKGLVTPPAHGGTPSFMGLSGPLSSSTQPEKGHVRALPRARARPACLESVQSLLDEACVPKLWSPLNLECNPQASSLKEDTSSVHQTRFFHVRQLCTAPLPPLQ